MEQAGLIVKYYINSYMGHAKEVNPIHMWGHEYAMEVNNLSSPDMQRRAELVISSSILIHSHMVLIHSHMGHEFLVDVGIIAIKHVGSRTDAINFLFDFDSIIFTDFLISNGGRLILCNSNQLQLDHATICFLAINGFTCSKFTRETFQRSKENSLHDNYISERGKNYDILGN